jgi:hypothetical protein
MPEVRRLIEAAALARDRVVRAVDGLSPAQAAFRPAPSEWSVTENVEHLAIVEVRYANRIWAAADGIRQGRPIWQGEPVLRGRTIEELVATWPPGRRTSRPSTKRGRASAVRSSSGSAPCGAGRH